MSYYNYGHHDYQQPPPPPPQQNGGSGANIGIDAEINVARSQMIDAMARVSQAMRVAADQADMFVRVVARSNPQVAATLLAQMGSGPSTTQQDLFGLAGFPSMGYGHGQAVMQAPQPPQQQQQQQQHQQQQHQQSMTPRGSASTPTPAHQSSYAAPAASRKASDKPDKKVKKVRDPNMPKRPPSAYLLYQNEVRDELREKHKDFTYPQILQKISEQWKMLSAPQRKIYQDSTAREMAQWSILKKQYDEAKGGAGAQGADGEDESEDEDEEVGDAPGGVAHATWNSARDLDSRYDDVRMDLKNNVKSPKEKRPRGVPRKNKEWKV